MKHVVQMMLQNIIFPFNANAMSTFRAADEINPIRKYIEITDKHWCYTSNSIIDTFPIILNFWWSGDALKSISITVELIQGHGLLSHQ